MNRLYNTKNPAQGKYKKVLCVCSAGLLRSPTAAVVLAGEPFNFNTRAVGMVKEYALIPIDVALLEWADEVVVMEKRMYERLKESLGEATLPVICLDIEDNYHYRDPELMELIRTRYPERLAALTSG